jgi:hypothetical protein
MNPNKLYDTLVAEGYLVQSVVTELTMLGALVTKIELLQQQKETHMDINPCSEIELPKMNTSLRTQADAISAIRLNHLIVGSVAANGDFSVSASPVVHVSPISARAEAKRLAQLSPGKAFVILGLYGAEMVPANTLSI